MVSPSGIVKTVAGNGTGGFSGDGGPATSAALNPIGVATDSAGNLFVADGRGIRKISPNGIITAVAGTATVGFSGDHDFKPLRQSPRGKTGRALVQGDYRVSRRPGPEGAPNRPDPEGTPGNLAHKIVAALIDRKRCVNAVILE